MGSDRSCLSCRTPLVRDARTGAMHCPACNGAAGGAGGGAETWELGGAVDPAAGAEETPAQIGDYEVIGEVSRGGMGVIYKVRQPGLDRVVAMKVLIAGRDASADQVKRFLREARAAARLKHPSIVPIHDVGSDSGKIYFTMDLVEGESLHDRLRRGPLPVEEGVRILRQIASAIQFAHAQGVIHRDIKPGNILLHPDGRAMLTDFGLARTLDSETIHTRSGTTMGTPNYMPPEQARGNIDQIDERSDLYSLGAVFYEMLTGVPPHVAEREVDVLLKVIHEDPLLPSRRVAGVPVDLQTICMACLEKDRARRYASAADFVADLDAYAAGEPIRARPASTLYLLSKKARKHRGVVAASMAGLLLSAGILSYAKWKDYRGEQRAREDERRRDEEKRLQAEEQARISRRYAEAFEAFRRGAPAESVGKLEAFLQDHPGASQAADAEWTLGLALMDLAGQRLQDGADATLTLEEAHRRFSRFREEGPRKGLRSPTEVDVWLARCSLWRGEVQNFEEHVGRLERHGFSRVQASLEILKDAPRPVAEKFQRWVEFNLADRRPVEPAEIRVDLEKALFAKLHESAAQKVMALLAVHFELRDDAAVLTWGDDILKGADYKLLHEAKPFLRMSVELVKAASLLRLRRDGEVEELLSGWDRDAINPEPEFRQKFPADPRAAFRSRPENREPDPRRKEEHLDWQKRFRAWEAENRQKLLEYDDAWQQVVQFKLLQVQGAKFRVRALCNLGRQEEAVVCLQNLRAAIGDLQRIEQARVELLRGTALVEQGDYKGAGGVFEYILNRYRGQEFFRVNSEASDWSGNLLLRESIATGDRLAVGRARDYFERAWQEAHQARDAERRAEGLLKSALARLFEGTPESVALAAERFRMVEAMEKDPAWKLQSDLHLRAAALMLGKITLEEFRQDLQLSDPSQENDAELWASMRTLLVDRDVAQGRLALKECMRASRGHEWPQPFVEALLRRLEGGDISMLPPEPPERTPIHRIE